MTTTRRNFLRTGAATLAALPVLAAQAQTTHTVTIKNFAFSPADLTIAAGDTVTWVNDDSTSHSAWEDSGNTFDTGLIRPAGSASQTFSGTGSFSYRCRPHGNMRGSITVG
ncbi:putative blue copper protein [Octadecabacter antarcticus 307]|uniref:Putative blue copper protein n=1 Tax=Octadecabacter antarcticus 307 TaxID=391626 RepID=M9R6Z3_9RHOB|nr:plastocyanin/azurin family copper-binding protein [Octadecabacter antarcticus]AGI68419.1 putative blue copper protein [Octadecabacter antarcticus 307]